jgi:dolichol kinase
MKRELARKAIHLSSAAVPVGVWLAPRSLAVAMVLAAAGLALVVELARRTLRPVRYAFLRRTRTLLRPHERRGLAGATWMALAYAAAVLLFPRPVAVAAMLFNALGDAAAALVGKRWGRHRTAGGKSWEGFAAGLVVNAAAAAAVAALAPEVGLAATLAGALAAALAEIAPLPLDDNLRVTLAGGGAILLAAALGA